MIPPYRPGKEERAVSLFQRIVHPTDFDEPSREAFRVARHLAQLCGAKVIAYHVVAPPAAVTGDGRVLLDPKSPTPADLWTDYRAAAADTPGVGIDYAVVVGDVGEAKRMLFELIRPSPDGVLIVMGTQGRTGLRRLIWGNRSEEVVREAPCPVLVVKEAAAKAAAST
jgi:nucleotide-binding universal stress UspA family protein